MRKKLQGGFELVSGLSAGDTLDERLESARAFISSSS